MVTNCLLKNENILDKEQEANKQTTAPNGTLPKAGRSWWQQLFGSE
jgi:hypothetical protein